RSLKIRREINACAKLKFAGGRWQRWIHICPRQWHNARDCADHSAGFRIQRRDLPLLYLARPPERIAAHPPQLRVRPGTTARILLAARGRAARAGRDQGQHITRMAYEFVRSRLGCYLDPAETSGYALLVSVPGAGEDA